MTTRTVSGHKLTLVPGLIYRAERPMAERGQKAFDVSIVCLVDNTVAAKVKGLSYEDSNKFLRRFNNGPSSWEGREW